MQLPTRQTAEAVSDGSLLRKVSQVKVGRQGETRQKMRKEGHVIHSSGKSSGSLSLLPSHAACLMTMNPMKHVIL